MNTPYEHGFILSLLILAIGALVWLFTPFIPALFLALLLTIATFSQYKKFREHLSDASAALLMTLLIISLAQSISTLYSLSVSNLFNTPIAGLALLIGLNCPCPKVCQAHCVLGSIITTSNVLGKP
jgi:predicted PurR-regulated permease PerM